MHRFNARGLAGAILAIVTTALMTATLVLGVSGAADATRWTGTIGVIALAVWMVVINLRRRPITPSR